MKITLLAAVGAAAIASSSASATIVNITVNGKVGFGIDSLGLFAPAGSNMDGAAYRMDFAYDITNVINYGFGLQAAGGTFFNRPSPIRRGDLTINGTTVSAINPYDSDYSRFNYPAFSQLYFSTSGPNGINYASFFWSPDQPIELPLDAPLNRTFGAGDAVFSGFQRANAQLTVFTYLSLQPTTLKIAVAPAVPEAATWAMMIAGFALAGTAAGRRRHGKAAHA